MMGENIKLQKKTSMTYFDLLAWLRENKNELENCIIDNIYEVQNAENSFIIKLYCNGKDKELLIEPGRRINFTRYNYPKSSSGKAILLRELIRGNVISEVNIVDSERILVMTLKKNGIKLIVELLPKGLLVITDNENKILFSTEYKEFRDRKIFLGEQYITPPKPQISDEEMEKLLKKGNLTKLLGISQEVLIYLDVKEVNKNNLEDIKEKIRKLEEEIKNGNIKPCILDNLTVIPFLINNCKSYEKFNDALDDFFYTIAQEELEQKKSREILEKKSKILNSIEQLKKSISEYEQKEAMFKRIGELLLHRSYEIEQMIPKNEKKRNIKIDVDNIEIEVDPTISVAKNASKYFEMMKEYRRKVERAIETLKELEERLKILENEEIERKKELKISLRKKEWYEKYRWTITRNGLLVIGGKDASQNESIVKKYMKEKDIFLHADIVGAPATIIKVLDESKQVSDEDLYDAAIIAACYSKAWKVGLGAVDVFWVFGNQVSLTPPTGEYLSKGSFMIYGKKNFINKVRLELALGIILNNSDQISVIVGSEEAVKTRTNYYVIVSPGDDEKDKISEKIIKIFQRLLPNTKGLYALKEEIMDKLPGKSKIIKVSNLHNNDKIQMTT
ncbi:fibronectin-binding domain-containing protein [Sulfolobus sp. F1]|nr:fibronectin-binding domain-containing protein [Sulfolobus sp. F1]